MKNIENLIPIEEEIPVLLRETLDDIGDRYYNSSQSPDIIVMDRRLYQPQKVMQDTYDRDINERADGSGKQYLYVRCRNLSNKPLENIYIHLYRNHLSLYNDPKDWSQYKIPTETGEAPLIERLSPGEIGVAPVFIYDDNSVGANPNCFVAVACREKEADFTWIDNYKKYVQWINRKNVAARNVVIQTADKGEITQELMIKNIEDIEISVIFLAKVDPKKTDAGIEYGFHNIELGIDKNTVCNKYITGKYSTEQLWVQVVLPPGYSGYLKAWTKGEINSRCKVDFKFYKVEPENSALQKYSVTLEHPDFAGMGLEDTDSILVPIGECSLQNR